MRAILIAKAYADKLCPKNFSRASNQKFQEAVEKLAAEVGIDLFVPGGIPELKRIEEALQDYQITLYNQYNKWGEILYQGPVASKFLYICYTGSHFNVVSSMAAFLNRNYYCNYCKIAFNTPGNHSCGMVCRMCGRPDCDYLGQHKCAHCEEPCNNEICLRIHQEKLCYKITTCQICSQKKHRKHVCGAAQRWCFNCKKGVDWDHRCYMLKDKHYPNKKEVVKKKNESEEEQPFAGIITFDYECYQDEVHIPNLVIAEKICKDCLDSDDRCDKCGVVVFHNNLDFCDWLFAQQNFVAIAHNLKGYDGCFMLQYINQNIMPDDGAPKVIANGSSLLSITFRKVKLIDSLSFFPTALENLPKMFDIKELKKGYFPHNFNKPSNFDYIGPYPGKEYYGYKFFCASKKESFDAWYESKSNQIFDFKQELHDYCLSDVKLLSADVLAFRKIILNISRDKKGVGLDPWEKAVTIPSLCLTIFRRNMMPKDSIAIIPEYGYNPTHKTSLKCQQWLKYLSKTRNVSIK